MTDPKTGSRNIQYEPGASCDNRKQKVLKIRQELIERIQRPTENPTERAPCGPGWNDLSNKINKIPLDYKTTWIIYKV